MVSDVFDVADDLPPELILNFLSLLQHFSGLIVLKLAFDLNMYFLSKAFSDSVLIIHEPPGGRVFPDSIGYSDGHLEISQLLGTQGGYFNVVSEGDSRSGVQMGVFRPLLVSFVYYAQLNVFKCIRLYENGGVTIFSKPSFVAN